MKKVILVPNEITQVIKPVDKTLENLDSEMTSIIYSTNIPLDAKLLKYNQVLQRFKFLQTERNKPYSIEIEERGSQKLDFDKILKGIPEKKIPAAKLLTDFISKLDNIHIESNGEISINGHRISNSNIIDLVHDLVRDRKTNMPPLGIEPLTFALKQANVPMEYIGNKNRLDLFQANRSPRASVGRRIEQQSPRWNE
jgi:hypothetical protein